MIDQEKLTLELCLLCWYEFYQKCHELENNILIKDYKLSLCSNIKSSKYSGDITERELTWKDTYFSYNYENKILPKFNNYFEEKYHFDQLYENYRAKITLQNKYYKSKIETLYSQEIYYSKEEKLKNKIGWTTAIVIFVILDIIWLFGMGVLKNNINDDALLFTKIIGIPLGAAFFSVPVAIISAIILGITKLITGIVIKNKNKTIKNQIQLNESYIERIQDKYSWIKSYNEGKDYQSYEDDLEIIKKEYDGWIKTEKLKIETEVNNLKVLKNKLGKIFPLPYKYSEEYVVTALLSLL